MGKSILAIIFIFACLFIIRVAVAMWLWNWLAVDIFGAPVLSFGQTFGLGVLVWLFVPTSTSSGD